MRYKETQVPDELREALQKIYGTSEPGPETLGEFARDYPQMVGVPEPGAFISEKPTRHNATVGGQTLYTHCFIDALMLPVLLRRAPVEIRSKSPTSGQTIMAVATLGTVEGSPPGAVMSFGAAQVDENDIQRCICPYVNAFVSRDEYDLWKAKTPEAATVAFTLPEAFAFARDMIGRLEVPEKWRSALQEEEQGEVDGTS